MHMVVPSSELPDVNPETCLALGQRSLHADMRAGESDAHMRALLSSKCRTLKTTSS